MLKISQIQTFTQKSDFIQTTFDLKVWIQTFAENSDQSGRPDMPPNIDGRLKIHKIRLNSDSFLPKSQPKFRLAWYKFRLKLTILWTIKIL